MVRLSEEDLRAILAIRMQTGIRSDNQAIVYAIHFTARQLEQKGTGKGYCAPSGKPQPPNRCLSRGAACGGLKPFLSID